MNASDIQKLNELEAEFQSKRNEIISKEGEIKVGVFYPELDRLFREMFAIMTGGTGKLSLSAKQIEEMAQ